MLIILILFIFHVDVEQNSFQYAPLEVILLLGIIHYYITRAFDCTLFINLINLSGL